jgi:cell division protein FtsI (penicillin-binding protein 3)
MLDRRLTWLTGITLVWAAAIFVKLFSLQVLQHRDYAGIARSQQEVSIEIPAPRGAILDRLGEPLALSVPTESVYLNPLRVPDLKVASDILSSILRLDREALYEKMKSAYENHRGFLWVKRKITFEEGRSLRNLRLDWIEIQSESQRRYPKGELAAHVLGSVDFEEKGNAGIEKALDADLRGQPGRARLLTDVQRRGIDSQLSVPARPGTPITLTIDERLQFAAEREIAMAVEQANAKTGSVVVMNPNTGDVLAMASYPTYDPNAPPQPGEGSVNRQNQAVSVPFEPGSVFKVITLSAALETTNLRPETLINCGNGAITLFGRTIHEAHNGYGIIPMAMVLAKSSNIGAIQIGLRVGQNNLYEYVRKFGFGQRTGIPLPAESGGKVRKLARWGKTSLPSVAMGQEVSVTTLQLAQAASIVANGGMLVKPRLILRKGDRATTVEKPARALLPETAITMRQMMEGVVLYGTGTRARLEGYTSGGKTGSAQIFDTAIGHFTHSYNASFMGFAPLTNPAIVVVVTLNGTHGSAGFGGAVAAPVFHTVATEALRIMDIPKDLPEDLPGKPSNLLAAGNAGQNDLAIADLETDHPNILLEDADDETETAPAKTPSAAAPPASVAAAPPASEESVGPKVPNFRGMTMRAVLTEAAAKGLPVVADGSGAALAQNPPPGAILHPGERIRVHFAR